MATKPRNWLFNIFREWSEWLTWLESALVFGINDEKDEGKQLKANVLKAIGDVQQFRKQSDAALTSYQEALRLFKEIGDHLGEANVLSALCRISVSAGDLQLAEKQLAEIVQMRRDIGDLYSEGADYFNFSIALLDTGNKAKAKEYVLKARPIFDKINLPAIVEMVDRVIADCEK